MQENFGLIFRTLCLGVQSWSPFATRKSGHIWRIWAERTQTLVPKSTKVAQIHLPERNSTKIRPISAKFFRQKLAKIPPNFRQISQISFHKSQRLRNHYEIQQMAISSGKICGFSTPGVADICRKPCDLRSETQIPPSREWRKLSQNPVAVFSCSG